MSTASPGRDPSIARDGAEESRGTIGYSRTSIGPRVGWKSDVEGWNRILAGKRFPAALCWFVLAQDLEEVFWEWIVAQAIVRMPGT